jgi:hypothetical protein
MRNGNMLLLSRPCVRLPGRLGSAVMKAATPSMGRAAWCFTFRNLARDGEYGLKRLQL